MDSFPYSILNCLYFIGTLALFYHELSGVCWSFFYSTILGIFDFFFRRLYFLELEYVLNKEESITHSFILFLCFLIATNSFRFDLISAIPLVLLFGRETRGGLLAYSLFITVTFQIRCRGRSTKKLDDKVAKILHLMDVAFYFFRIPLFLILYVYQYKEKLLYENITRSRRDSLLITEIYNKMVNERDSTIISTFAKTVLLIMCPHTESYNSFYLFFMLRHTSGYESDIISEVNLFGIPYALFFGLFFKCIVKNHKTDTMKLLRFCAHSVIMAYLLHCLQNKAYYYYE